MLEWAVYSPLVCGGDVNYGGIGDVAQTNRDDRLTFRYPLHNTVADDIGNMGGIAEPEDLIRVGNIELIAAGIVPYRPEGLRIAYRNGGRYWLQLDAQQGRAESIGAGCRG